MDERRPRIDLFAFALGALTLLTAGFFYARNGAAVIMCALCLGGLLFARFVGFSNRALVPATVGLVVLLWVLWIDPPPLGNHTISALAHGTGGLLVGWAVAEFLRSRAAWPLWAIGAVGVVFGLTILWELGEFVGDRAFQTALLPSRRDSALDITFGTIGGAIGTFIAVLVPSPRRPG
jgi:hypothetical protein